MPILEHLRAREFHRRGLVEVTASGIGVAYLIAAIAVLGLIAYGLLIAPADETPQSPVRQTDQDVDDVWGEH